MKAPKSQVQHNKNDQHTCPEAKATDLKEQSTFPSQCKPGYRWTLGQNFTQRTLSNKKHKKNKKKH